MTNKKKAPAVTPRAQGDSRSKDAGESKTVPAEGPGRKFWLKTAADGGETAYAEEPAMPHLTVEVVKARNGRLVEQTWTRTHKVWLGLDKGFVTPRPKSPDWKVHVWPAPETISSSASWRRLLSRGWRPLDGGKSRHGGKVWWRPGRPRVEEKVLATYFIIERPEGGEPIYLQIGLIDTGTDAGLVEQTATSPEVNLQALGLGWEPTERGDPTAVVWRRPYVGKGSGS